MKKYYGIHHWIKKEHIVNERGDAIEFDEHPFLFDIYADKSQYLTVMKPAQVGMSTLQVLKNHYDAKAKMIDIIYILPTDKDVQTFVGGKVNRIIAMNPSMLQDVADKDSIEQKQVGNSMIYFRGSWTKKTAIMVTADRLAIDEKDSSKLDILADYQARLQHSKYKETHTFSHPSITGVGVHKDFLESDQKEWFVKCGHCNHWQFLSWDLQEPKRMSIDLDKQLYVCKKCRKELYKWDIQLGQWVKKYKDKEWSGYHITLMMAPWMTAKEIIKRYNNPETTDEFFYTKMLGLPWEDSTAKLLKRYFIQNLTGEPKAPSDIERVVIGIDTGLKIDYVMGNENGLFYYGNCNDYTELDKQMKRWKRAIAIIDAGGDLIGSRAFQERWLGRVYLCFTGGDRKRKEIIHWGEKDEHGAVYADRNRMIQLVIDEYRTKRLPIHGTENDWYEYWLDWNNVYRIKVIEPDTNVVKGYKFVRSGRDHLAMATIYWRVGISRFSSGGTINIPEDAIKPTSYELSPLGDSAEFDPEKMFGDFDFQDNENDWRASY